MGDVTTIFTGNNMQHFMLVVAALIGLFLLIGNAICMFKTLSKFKDNSKRESITLLDKRFEVVDERLNDLKTKLINDNSRITILEEKQVQINEGFKVLCNGLQALLRHAIHDGNTDELDSAQHKIEEFLINK